MNIVYLLTNTSKTEGKRFYVGSKQECQIVDVDGVPTMIGRDGKPYYSSSGSFELRQDVLSGHVLSASILENVPDKNILLQKENEWIRKLNAVQSEEYYNISDAHLNVHNQDAIANLYGETVRELACNNSSVGKRDNGAKTLGFSNFGLLCFHLWDEFKECGNWASIASKYGKHRHWAVSMLKKYDMVKAKEDLSKVTQEQVRELISKKCSLFKVAEILEIEIPTARILLGDFNKTSERSYSVALFSGMSRGELEASITRDILDGMTLEDTAKKHKTNKSSARRYFMRCIRRHLTSGDISDVIPETEEDLEKARAARREKQTKVSWLKSIADSSVVPIYGKQMNNKSGITGVFKSSDGLMWTAQWVDSEGKKKTKSFSISKYGNEEAFNLATHHRKHVECIKLEEAA